MAKKLPPLEQEIKTRERRVDRAKQKIADIRKKADDAIAEVERDNIVLKALKAQKKK
jgi:hypothetical protein